MPPPKMPIGVQSFEKMRTEGYAYVDKTWFISDMVAKGSIISFPSKAVWKKSLYRYA